MKKALLTLFVIATFAVYSFDQRHHGLQAAVGLTTPSTTSQTSTAPATTQPSSPPSTPTATTNTRTYKDGQYKGSTEDAFYGMVQVRATILGGKLAAVDFLSYPSDRSTSVYINSQAMPMLKQEAIKAQSAKIDIISGATYTSQAFIQSLTSALNGAKA